MQIKRITQKIKSLFDISFIDSVYKLLIFGDLFRVAFPSQMKRYICSTKKMQQQTLERLKGKSEITVVFFLQTPSTWKYDALYRKLQQSERFKPTVVICPYNVHLSYSKAECLRVMQQTAEFARSKGYSYISAYDERKGKWLDIRRLLNPDVVFFTKPYKDTNPNYYIYKFRSKITCYTSYGVHILQNRCEENYNLPLHNLLAHFFLETDLNVAFAQEYSLRKAENVSVSGNLGMEQIMDKSYTPKDVWKPHPAGKKRIIWAPHHTINYLFNSSNFLVYCNFMLDMAKRYEDRIQFAFKPHPILKFRLLNLWGKEKTEAYYQQWATGANTQLEEGYYDDLFLTSDAMIHDSITFTAEYLYTKKPALFTVRDQSMENCWTNFGYKAFNLHYHAHSEQDIEDFIRQVALNGSDPKAPAREAFYADYLYPKDGIMPSEKIYKLLEEETK